MQFATKPFRMQVSVWLIWFISCLIFLINPTPSDILASTQPILSAVALHDENSGSAFPWKSKRRLRKWAWKRYQALKSANKKAKRMAWFAHLALSGTSSMAQVADWIIRSQLVRHLGAFPFLYDFLEKLKVDEIINRYTPTKADVDYGTVAMLIILNRLMAPRPFYKLADWASRTVLVYRLGVPASKFNDDRLGRTLDAISPHVEKIWQAVVIQALLRGDIDLSIVFYDLSAFVAHGDYADSEYVDFGFAHNTPMNKKKFKIGLNVSADGNIPLLYKFWSGRSADKATVEINMAMLKAFLEKRSLSRKKTIIIGDRANLDDKLAFAYEKNKLSYLSGLQAHRNVHKELLVNFPEKHFYENALTKEKGPKGYWGKFCRVPFENEEEKRTIYHRGLVVLSGPMRTALRKDRAEKIRDLRQELRELQAKIGKPHYRGLENIQRKANSMIKKSTVGKFMHAEAFLDGEEKVQLRWWIDKLSLWKAMQRDGRYLLVTNDWLLSDKRMLELYREKDGVEKRFTVAKSDLKVSPIYLHKDNRIEAMLLLNMLALLAYSLLEREMQNRGLHLTTRKIIEKLDNLSIVESALRNGETLYRIVHVDEEQELLLECLSQILHEFNPQLKRPLQFGTEKQLYLNLPPPDKMPLIA